MKLHRRTFLSVAALSSLLGRPMMANSGGVGSKSVVWIWLGGGASSTEFCNPIPDAPSEYRAINGFTNTRTGYQLGGDFPLIGSISDKFTTVRSFCHKDNNHGSATNWVMVGSPIVSGENIPQADPSHGCVVSSFVGENTRNGIPTYTKVNPIQYDGPAWLNSRYGGFTNDKESIDTLRSRVERERLANRLAMLSQLDRSNTTNWDASKEVANNILCGDCADTFNIELEDEKVRAKYRTKESSLGQCLLLSKRLISSGGKFINLTYNGWDLHWDISKQTQRVGAELDYQLFNFITDLESTGQLNDTLIVVATEFGRTPKLNDGHPTLSGGAPTGRDHYANVVPLLLIGANYQTGAVLGETDKFNSEVISSPFHPEDLRYTVLNHFGIDKVYTLVDSSNRPHRLIEEEAKLII